MEIKSYYRARYYDSTLGRFLREDPIRFSAGVNFYEYVLSSPINRPDPLGLCPNSCPRSGNAPSPRQYQAMGAIAGGSWFFGFGVGAGANLGSLMFKRGWPLDAQVIYGGSPAYANYVYGVYMCAAGYPLPFVLAGANWYGAHFSKYTSPDRQMDPNYPAIPASNVANIIQGCKDQKNGTLCTPN